MIKKIIFIFIISVSLFMLSGCFNDNSKNNENISESKSNKANLDSKEDIKKEINKGEEGEEEISKLQQVVGKIGGEGDLGLCEENFEGEKTIECKREYITQNADEVKLKICESLKDEGEINNCKDFLKNIDKGEEGEEEISKLQQVVGKMGGKGDLGLCEENFEGEKTMECKREYITQNADEVKPKICENLKDEGEINNCKEFLKNIDK